MTLEKQFFFVNDRILPAQEAALQISDLGLFRGYGVFDYFRTQSGKPFLMPRYLRRFRLSAQQMRLTLALSDAELEKRILELIRLNRHKESGVRLLLTGGYSENIFTPGKPNLLIRIEKSSLPDNHFYSRGIKLISTEYQRDLPAVKTTNYLKAVHMWPEVEAAGATELLYHAKGEWLECSRSNFFVVQQGRLLTPPVGQVLGGITREVVIELAREQGISVEEKPLPLDILTQAQEAFISGTTKKVMPVVEIDGEKIGSGAPGPVSRQLLNAWQLLEQQPKTNKQT